MEVWVVVELSRRPPGAVHHRQPDGGSIGHRHSAGEVELTPTPVVELNLAAAVAMADGPAVGLAMMDGLAAAGELDDYPYLHAARADLLRRLGRRSEADAAYRRALELTTNGPERSFLEGRIREVEARRPPFDQTGTPS